MEAKAQFLNLINESLATNRFVKLTLSKPDKGGAIKNVFIRPVVIRNTRRFAFTYRYPHRDEVKNYLPDEALRVLDADLGKNFFRADLFTLERDASLVYNKKRQPRLLTKAASHQAVPSQSHDRKKNRLVETKGQIYLRALGITDQQGKVHKRGQRKYRQINKYIEIIDSLLKKRQLPQNPNIVDMGSGKGYLTFALYDYLFNTLGLQVKISGIELRQQLVDFCNDLAQKADYEGLEFIAADITDYQPEKIDMLIALHACDTATDLAIAKGIEAGAGIIVVAPCCHKQIRSQMNCQTDLEAVLRHGILKERQAELITDGIRSLILEFKGYRTKVFEFVDTEHTPKNLLIVGLRSAPDTTAMDRVNAIKKEFGIEYHHLEKLLGII